MYALNKKYNLSYIKKQVVNLSKIFMELIGYYVHLEFSQ